MLKEKVIYKNLQKKAQETYNYQKLSGILAEYGYATNWLNVDFKNADFIAVHFFKTEPGKDILKIQLKGRLTIDRKYEGKGIYISFPLDDSFCLIKHSDLVKIVEKTTNWLKSDSWIKNGGYSRGKPPEVVRKELLKYKI